MAGRQFGLALPDSLTAAVVQAVERTPKQASAEALERGRPAR